MDPNTLNTDPSNTPVGTTPSNLQQILQQATEMANQGGPGHNSAAAEAWLKQKLASQGVQTQKPTGLSFQDLKGGNVQPSESSQPLTFDQLKSQPTSNPTTEDVFKPESSTEKFISSLKTGLAQSIGNPLKVVLAKYIDSFVPSEHEVKNGGQVTPSDQAAAKILGVQLPKSWGPIYSIQPQQSRKITDFTYKLLGLNPQEQAQREKAVASGASYAGPVEAMSEHSTLKDFITSKMYPFEPQTQLYHKIQEIKQLQYIVANPSKYKPHYVQEANKVLADYKANANKGNWQQVKDSFEAIKNHPLGLINGLNADPELLAAPEIDLGAEGMAARGAAETAAAERAAQTANIAQKVAEASKDNPEIYAAATKAVAEHTAQAAELSASGANTTRLAKLAKVASSGGSGAGINAAISAEQQKVQQGYIQKGSLPAAAITGAVMGGGLGIFHEVLGGKGEPMASEPTPVTGKEPTTEAPTQPSEEKPSPRPNIPKVSDIISGARSRKEAGNINKELLATGVTVGGGAGAGAYFAPQGKKKAAAVAGGLAGLFTGMNMWGDAVHEGGVPKSQRGMFVGPLSRAWDTKAAKMADTLERYGKNPEEIFQATGLSKTSNGKWTKEIPDQQMKLKDYDSLDWDVAQQSPVPVSKLMEHSKLLESYPHLGDLLKVKIDKDELGNSLGSFSPKTNTLYIKPPEELDSFAERTNQPIYTTKGVILHEIQHLIQHIEGWPEGGNIDAAIKKVDKTDYYLEKKQDDIWNKLMTVRANSPEEKALMNKYDKLQALREKYNKQIPYGLENRAFYEYSRSAGETQARNVQTRMLMPEEELAKTHPELTEDIARKHQTIKLSKQPVFEPAHGSLADHLNKTQEMTPEGNLHGMVLDEDKLPNESEVVDRAKNGDQRAIGALYNKYMPRLIRSLRSPMRAAGPKLGIDAEDVAQETFMKAINNLHSFKGDSAFYTWLYRLGRNTAIDAIRKGERQVPATSIHAQGVGGGNPLEGGIEPSSGSTMIPEAEKAAAETDTPEGIFVANQVSNMVKHAISKLPNDIREAVKLKEMEGLTEQEIAAKQGVPVGTVKSRLYRGRNMIAESIKRGHGARFRKQGGFATPEQLKKLAKVAVLGTVGATIGAKFAGPDHQTRGAWEGAALALVGGEVNWRNFRTGVKNAFSKKPWVNVNDLTNEWDGFQSNIDRLTAGVQTAIHKLAPSDASKVKITHYLDGNTSVKLTPNEMEAAKIARRFYDYVGGQALESGVLKDFLMNYVNHEWGDSAAAKELENKIVGSISTRMSPKDRHALARKFMTLDMGKAHGLKPKTENINELINIYSKSMGRAIANKNLLDGLKARVLGIKDGKNVRAMMSAGKAPPNYVAINHPQLHGYLVHPSLAPSLDFLFHTYRDGPVRTGVYALNTATKRLNVSLSMFHVKALLDAFSGAMPFSEAFKSLAQAGKSFAGKSEFHQQYLTGSEGDVISKLLDNGLKITPPKGRVVDEDINTDFYGGLDVVQKFADNIPGVEKIPGALRAVNKAADRFVWENVHAGLKGTVAMNAYERLSRAWAHAAEKDPSVRMPSQDELARMAASFSNDVFGGLNWRRLADDATTRIGRAFGLAMASPAGRRLSQLLLFAPDWTYSTIRSFVKATGEGSGLKGLLKPKTLADLHRQYLLRSAIIYLTLYNGINMAFSGHPIWDNKDPLTVDLGNGERMQANKHFMEVPHLLMHPTKYALGKLGIIPSEVAEQVLHKEYLSPDYSPEMQESRAQHLLKRFMPFWTENLSQQGTPEALANLAGFPIYGSHAPRTAEERRVAEKKKEERRAKARAAARKRREKRMFGG